MHNAQSEVSALKPDQTRPISEVMARFVSELSWDKVPSEVIERAKLHILDAIGIAMAASRYDYSKKTLKSMSELAGVGNYPVIGMNTGLPLRDAAQMNGFLMHALDFDDTHVAGVVHATCTALSTLLAMGQKYSISGRELLISYLAAIEVDARIGMAAKGAFHRKGFHPTGVVGAFGATVAAGKAAGISISELIHAQGIVLSMASGTLGFLEEGAWNKRLHAGWASVAGITAVELSKNGFQGPTRPYEGTHGLYDCFTENGDNIEWNECTQELGIDWEMLRVGIKPYPACHLVHSCADAAKIIIDQHDLSPDDISSIKARVAKDCMGLVCYPIERKRRPLSGYEAQFSVPYAIASIVVKGQLTLAELEPEAFTDPKVLEQCDKVDCESDPESAYPEYFSGEVTINTIDGGKFSCREQVNRGADSRPLPAEDIIAKFRSNAELSASAEHSSKILEAVFELDANVAPKDLAHLLGRF